MAAFQYTGRKNTCREGQVYNGSEQRKNLIRTQEVMVLESGLNHMFWETLAS